MKVHAIQTVSVATRPHHRQGKGIGFARLVNTLSDRRLKKAGNRLAARKNIAFHRKGAGCHNPAARCACDAMVVGFRSNQGVRYKCHMNQRGICYMIVLDRLLRFSRGASS
jgi:hypothetical protein